MKKVTKFFMAALLAGMCSFGYAQSQPDYMKAPKLGEKIIGTTSFVWQVSGDGLSKQEQYRRLLEKAKQDFPNKVIDIRNMEEGKESWISHLEGDYGETINRYTYIGKVVEVIGIEAQVNESFSQAVNKALRNVREGSRLAIDQITVISTMDRETLKDQLLDVLLDKGYRVVAKDYLEKLYEEQKDQQSGIYNDKTTVQENNFSAVGYYINVKVTESSLRVQVVNVSTGEYEGNATVNF